MATNAPSHGGVDVTPHIHKTPPQMAAALQGLANGLQRLRYSGGQGRADVQKSSFNHRDNSA